MNNSTGKPVIRFARASDAGSILDIYRPIVESTAISFEWQCPSEADIVSRIERVARRHCWLVCEINGQVCGYAYASSFRYRKAYDWVTEVSVYIAEFARRRRMAIALYDALHAILQLQGYRVSMAVMTSPNPISRAFHFHYGFVSEGIIERIGYKFGKWYGVEIFRLDLVSEHDTVEIIRPIDNLSNHQTEVLFQDYSSKIIYKVIGEG